MTDTNPAKFKKLVTLLRELFQLDQPDLDFGRRLPRQARLQARRLRHPLRG